MSGIHHVSDRRVLAPLVDNLAAGLFFALLFFAAMEFGPETARAGALQIEPVGAWGGSVDAIQVVQQGDQRIAYIGSGIRLVILDVTNPAAIIELSSVMLDAVIMDLEVRDGYAYIGAVAVWDHPSPNPASRFCVVDVHDVTNPFLVARNIGASWSVGLYRHVAIDGAGRTAYVSPSGSVPQAIDITDPTAPVFIGECGGGSPPLFSGGLQYWVNVGDGFVGTMDMSAVPDSCPGVLGGYVHIPALTCSSKGFSGSALAGNYLYVTAHTLLDRHSLIFVVDFSDLAAPVHVGTWGDPTGDSLRFAGAVAASEGRLYWAGSGRFDPLSRTLVILDIATDPTTPTLLGEYASDANFTDIFVLGTTAYLGDTREGLTIVDCSNPAAPVRTGNYFSPAHFYRGVLDGDHLYVTDYSYGVSILDVSDPRTPRLKGKWETGTYTPDRRRMQNFGIAVRDDKAYVAAGYGGLQVLNVSDPAAPTLAGSFANWPAGDQSVALALSPNEPIVHLGTIPGAWIVNMDVSDPTNIVEVGAVFIDGLHAKPLTIVRRPDGIGYVARELALVTLDLADRANPLLLGIAGPQPYDLALSGNTLFATGDSDADAPGLNILDVETVDHLPAPIASYNDPSELVGAHAVTVAGPYAYLGTETSSEGLAMQVLDISDRTAPILLQKVPTGTAKILDLIVDGITVYAITESSSGTGGGVLVYQVFSGGDGDNDRDVDLQDYAALQRCFSGGAELPAGRVAADCPVFDFDGDGDVDQTDYAAFRVEMSEPR